MEYGKTVAFSFNAFIQSIQNETSKPNTFLEPFNTRHPRFIYTALQKFGNALEKCGFGRYQHKSLSFFGANTLK